jgi:hypothetical protein
MTTSPDDLEAVRKVIEALTPFNQDDQERIVRWAREKLGLSPSFEGTSIHPQSSGSRQMGSSTSSGGSSVTLTLKEFVEHKQPKADVHFAAAVAYYYLFEAKDSERKISITAADLQEACRLAKRKRFENPSVPLQNAFKVGYLDKVERGSYRLNSVGENLVAMALPGGAVVEKKSRSRKISVRKSKVSKRR